MRIVMPVEDPLLELAWTRATSIGRRRGGDVLRRRLAARMRARGTALAVSRGVKRRRRRHGFGAAFRHPFLPPGLGGLGEHLDADRPSGLPSGRPLEDYFDDDGLGASIFKRAGKWIRKHRKVVLGAAAIGAAIWAGPAVAPLLKKGLSRVRLPKGTGRLVRGAASTYIGARQLAPAPGSADYDLTPSGPSTYGVSPYGGGGGGGGGGTAADEGAPSETPGPPADEDTGLSPEEAEAAGITKPAAAGARPLLAGMTGGAPLLIGLGLIGALAMARGGRRRRRR